MSRNNLIALLLFALACCLIGPTHAAASSAQSPTGTVAYYNFEPKSGGPGTVVHVKGGQWYDSVAKIYISKDSPDKRDPFKPPGPPLATVNVDQYGSWEATIVIPARWSTGELIAQGPIFIVAPTEGSYFSFNFIPAALPPTGRVALGPSSPSETISTYGIEPTSGGPGTVVHVKGHQFWGTAVVSISKYDHGIPTDPYGPPLATATSDKDGNWSATIVIPDHWPSGEPIERGLIIIVAPTDVNYAPFNFIPAAMPPTGSMIDPVMPTILALLLLSIGVALSVANRKPQRTNSAKD